MQGGIYLHNDRMPIPTDGLIGFPNGPNEPITYGWNLADHYVRYTICPNGAAWWTIHFPLWMLLGMALTPSVIHV